MPSITSGALPVLIRFLAAAGMLCLLVVLSTTLSGCERGVLDPAGPVGGAERVIMLDALAIMLAIVVPTILCTLAFAWWYRATNQRALYSPFWAYSGRLELLVWSIPALVVVFLGGIAWISSHDLDPAKPLSAGALPLEVEVVALDWKWLFIYPEQHIASVNRLVAPVGVPVHFRLTSASVMNVFFVPQLGSEIYAMYGMTTELNLQADRAGSFHGLAAHINGDGFSDMTFETQAVSPQEFSRWLATAQAEGPALDEATYRGLLRQTSNVEPHTYRTVAPHLFQAIVSQQLPPGDGPRAAQTAATSVSLKEE